MSTRLYFSNYRASVDPEYSGTWFGTTQASRWVLNPYKDPSPIATGPTIALNATANRPELERQYITPGLNGNQTIAGLCSGQLMVREFNNTDDINQVRLCAKVVSNDGQTIRGTLLPLLNYGPTTEVVNNATLRNKTIVSGNGNVSVNSIAARDGDRIVLEIGYACTAGGTTPEAAAKWGGGGRYGPDLPINETQTTNAAGWFELGSVDLEFRQTNFIRFNSDER